jgi:hypothetical protein
MLVQGEEISRLYRICFQPLLVLNLNSIVAMPRETHLCRSSKVIADHSYMPLLSILIHAASLPSYSSEQTSEVKCETLRRNLTCVFLKVNPITVYLRPAYLILRCNVRNWNELECLRYNASA